MADSEATNPPTPPSKKNNKKCQIQGNRAEKGEITHTLGYGEAIDIINGLLKRLKESGTFPANRGPIDTHSNIGQ